MDKTKKSKHVKITIITILLAVLTYLYLCMILTPKTIDDMGGAKYYAAYALNEEDENTLDVVVLGNSDVYSGFVPMTMYDEYGITSFVDGKARQKAKNVRSLVKKMFKKQSPKVVVLDVDCFFQSDDEFNTADYNDFAFFYAPIKYHVRWKELRLRDFYTFPKPQKDPYKGFIYTDTYGKFNIWQNYMQDVSAHPEAISSKVKKDIYSIKDMCDNNGAELMFICIPTPYSWDNAKSNAVANLACEMNVEFIDYNLLPDFDYNKNFNDDYGDHLNVYGATLITRLLADRLTEKYTFADRRLDKNYESWNEVVRDYKNLLKSNGVVV